MKLVKFRMLGDSQSYCRAKTILQTGEFWCSKFWELNDPMEGVYVFSDCCRNIIHEVFSDKARRVICSFSGPEAFKDPTMWGYYANGFKGIAIELDVPDDMVRKMTYVPSVPNCESMHEFVFAEKILTTKLDRWEHEDEYRFLGYSDKTCSKRIGRITAVHFGNPYGTTINYAHVKERSKELRTFDANRSTLKSLAECMGIACGLVSVSAGIVTPADCD